MYVCVCVCGEGGGGGAGGGGVEGRLVLGSGTFERALWC